jgi:ABC-type dipeptide/oligopeptide/nickel transport system permease component
MWLYILKKLFSLLLVILASTAVVYFTARHFPGDPITVLYGETEPSPEARAALEAKLGLDKPMYIQLLLFWKRLFTGDWGTSVFAGEPVLNLIFRRYVNSLILALTATATTTALCILLAYISTMKSFEDMSSTLATASISMPAALWGIALMFALALLRVPIPFGSLAMPLATLTIAGIGMFYTVLKNLIDKALSEPFIGFYKAMGLGRARLFIKALHYITPVYVTAVLYRMGLIVAGAIATETLFSYPGMGRLLVEAFSSRDYSVLLGWATVVSATLALLNILGDLLHAYIDPRTREGK